MEVRGRAQERAWGGKYLVVGKRIRYESVSHLAGYVSHWYILQPAW